MRNRIAGALLAFFCAGSFAAVAFAQSVQPIDRPHPIIPLPRPTGGAIATPTPLAAPTFAPMPSVTPVASPLPGIENRFVLLSQLAPLPPRTAANTWAPGNKRPFAATGATMTVVSSANANCANSVGSIIALGCTVFWQSSGLTAGHTYKDYIVAPNVGNGEGGTLTGSAYTSASGAVHSTTLGVAGLYVFGTYDSTSAVWVAVTYVNVGSDTTVKVYQDAFHTQEAYQFDVSSASDAYLYATNLTASDYYVWYVESTSINPNCVFIAPSATITAGKLCNITGSAGAQAPGGALSVTWPITTSLSAGTYSVVLFDVTQNARLGQVQVSITGSGGGSIRVSGSATSANASPNPASNGTTNTIFAYDSSNDRSTGGVTLTSSAVPNGNYLWTVTDPTGQSWSSGTQAISGGTGSYTFAMSTFAQTTGNYIPKTFSAALYNTATKAVFASTNFQIAGYYVYTAINGTASLAISQGGSTPASLSFTNRSDTRFGTDFADSLAKIIFTTGPNFDPSSNAGDGITAALSGFSAGTCTVATPCTQTVTDSDGNSWTASDSCTTGGSGECTIELDPVVASTTLAPQSSITLANVGFANATGGTCTSSCAMNTSVLPAHGLTWSAISPTATDAYLPVYIAASGNSLTGTASVALSGAYQGGSGAYTSSSAETVEAHLFQPHTNHAQYERGSPYAITQNGYDILAFTLVNNSNNTNEDVIAIGLPGSYGSLSALDNFQLDPNLNSASNSRWVIDTSCSGAAATFGRKWLCLDGRNVLPGSSGTVNVPKGGTPITIYLDVNAAPTAFTYTDWTVDLADPQVYGLTASGTATIPIGASGSFTVDGLAYAQYSLNPSLMQANFQPAVTGTNTTAAESVVVTNTASSADPNPDYIDNVVIAIPSTTTIASPATATTGWTYLGSVTSGATKYYWYSVCSSGQATVGNLPPTTTPLTAKAVNLTACSAAQLANALGPGQTFTGTMNVTVAAANITGTMYAHGANGNGWTTGKSFTLTAQSVSASSGFSAAGGYPTPAPVATSNVPTIGGDASTTFGNAYTYSVKNTSSSTNITSFAILIPGTDIGGVNATDSAGQTWVLTGTPTLGGTTGGCTVTGSASATTAGANGYIDVGGGGCSLTPGSTMTVSFTAKGPSSPSDSYIFQLQNINGSGTLNSSSAPGTTGTEWWIGDTRIQVSLSIGLNITVNPSNPGPGSSNPIVSCSGCAFAGSTIDFGSIPASTTSTFSDVLRASVYITSTTAVNYTLSVQASNNPARIPAVPTNELLTYDDSGTSSSGAGITFDVTSATVIPTGSSLQLAHGTSMTSRSTPYDIIQAFQIAMGTEGVAVQTSTLTYTLIVN